jgi:hypothetical protein
LVATASFASDVSTVGLEADSGWLERIHPASSPLLSLPRWM